MLQLASILQFIIYGLNDSPSSELAFISHGHYPVLHVMDNVSKQLKIPSGKLTLHMALHVVLIEVLKTSNTTQMKKQANANYLAFRHTGRAFTRLA